MKKNEWFKKSKKVDGNGVVIEEINNNTVDLEIDNKKRKVKKVLNITCYILSGIFLIFLIIGCFKSCGNNSKSIKENNNNLIHRVVKVEDNNNEYFKFTYDDFDNDIFCGEFVDELLEYPGFSFTGTLYLDTVYNITGIYNADGDLLIGFNTDDFGITYDYETNYFDVNGDEYLLNNDVYFLFNGVYTVDYLENNYNNLYIVLNSHLVEDSGFNNDIFTAITDVVSNYTLTLSSGVAAILGLFWLNNQLTVLGTITVVVVGVALVYFLLRFVFGLVRLRG